MYIYKIMILSVLLRLVCVRMRCDLPWRFASLFILGENKKKCTYLFELTFWRERIKYAYSLCFAYPFHSHLQLLCFDSFHVDRHPLEVNSNGVQMELIRNHITPMTVRFNWTISLLRWFAFSAIRFSAQCENQFVRWCLSLHGIPTGDPIMCVCIFFTCTHNQFSIVITKLEWERTRAGRMDRQTRRTGILCLILIRIKIRLMLIDSLAGADYVTADQFRNHQINEMRLTVGPLICFALMALNQYTCAAVSTSALY